MVKEELYINGQTIELMDSLNPNLTFNIADIANPETRKADFSKTIILPASKRINKIFEFIFEVNIDLQTFNPNLKTDVVYLVDGEIQIDGYLQLKKINNIDQKITYDCVIVGRIGNFISVLGDKELNDSGMNWSTLNHDWTQANQVASWSSTTGYVYPMIDYATGVNLYDWGVTEMFPAAFAKEYIDRMFADVGYSYTSNFLTSAPFNKLIIPFNAKDFNLTSTSVGQRVFESETAQFEATSLTSQSMIVATDVYPTSDYQIKMTAETDPNGIYDTATGRYTCNNTGTYNLQFELDLTATFAPLDSLGVAPTVDVRCLSAIRGDLVIVHKDSSGNAKGGYTYTSGGTTIETGIEARKNFNITYTSLIPTGTPSVTTSGATYPDNNYVENLDNCRIIQYTGSSSFDYAIADWLNADPRQQSTQPNRYWVTANNVEIDSGDIIEVWIRSNIYGGSWIAISSGAGEPSQPLFDDYATGITKFYGSIDLNVANGKFKNQVVNTHYSEGNNINFNDAIPKKIKQKDFFMSIIKMFNLYIQPDPDNKRNLIIEPRDDFYTNDIVDWSHKLDNSKLIEQLPMAAMDAKDYLFKYKEDKDYYNELYSTTWGESYGEHKEEINNDFLSNTKTTEIVFSPTPIVGQAYEDRVIPAIKKYNDNNGQVRIESNIRILYYGGLISTNQIWEHRSFLTTSIFQTSYPYSGHLDNPFSPTLDINFGLTKEVYYDNTFNTITFSNNNLYNVYYKKFIEEITNVNSKIIKGYFYLTPSDIKNLSFKKQYYFDNSYFRLNKIENYNPLNPLTKCEFLKIQIAEVFTPETATSNGGRDSIAGVSTPLLSSATTNYVANSRISNDSVRSLGSNNFVDQTAKNVSVIGNNNYVMAGSENVIITGDNNSVDGKNISLINSSNIQAKNNNVSFINNEQKGAGASKLVYSNTIASQEISLYLCDTSSTNIKIAFDPNVTYEVGKTWTIKKLVATNQVNIDPTSINTTIDGATSKNLTSAYDVETIMYDGFRFNIL